MPRNNQPLLVMILEMIAKLPWWVGISLAVISYFGLGYIAGIPLEPTSDIGDMGGVVAKQMFLSFAAIFRYVLPFVFTLAALVSIFQSTRRKRLYGHLQANPSIQTLNDISWTEFELLVGQYFEKQGYQVRQLSKAGADGGVDLVIIKEGDKYLVQCKQWRAARVGVKVVRELLGAITAKGAVGGYVVTSGEFTQSASDFVRGRNIELINGRMIVASVDVDQLQEQGVSPYADSGGGDDASYSHSKNADAIVKCPKCGAEMVLRTAKRGANVGKQFYGCSTYPKCQSTRSAAG